MKNIWQPITETPPDELVEVKFSNGKKGRAYPTYYPFKIIDRKVMGCDNYWDGGWLVECPFSCLNHSISDNLKVTHWRKIDSS